MCGIAGVILQRSANEGDLSHVRQMIGQVSHRGPDDTGVVNTGKTVLGSARLAIVDVAHGQQPFSNETRDIHVVFNGEIYNYLDLRDAVKRRGHVLKSDSDGEVIAHLYEDFGTECFGLLKGQFAIAISDSCSNFLIIARDLMGICPLHWTVTADGFFFCSEIKGLLAIGVAPRQIEPEAIIQMSYFGTTCAPLTAFSRVKQLQPAHYLVFKNGQVIKTKRYWSLDFPLDGQHTITNERKAIEGLQQCLESAVESHMQGEFPATCFLSGGIDSAIIGALLKRRSGKLDKVSAFCATSDDRKMDEGSAAAETALRLCLDLKYGRMDGERIAAAFPKLIWHSEVPMISTEAAALMLLAEEVRGQSKIVLTGEGADEAFGGYLAFRQFKMLGFLTGSGLTPFRAIIRPLLQQYYGTDCLLPPECRLDSIRERLSFFPAQAYEWEFYRLAITPVLSAEYREMGAQDRHWNSFEFDQQAVRGRHWLNRSLYVAYQVMLPNYLLGAHGDRVFAANSIEGRYPFLSRDVVEYAATTAPELKIKGLQEKYILRRAAENWLPKDIAQRPKKRFVMPFGTPFIGSKAPRFYSDMVSSHMISAYGYFDPIMVKRLFEALAQSPRSGGKAKIYLERLALGLAANFVISTQLWHCLFIKGHELSELTGGSSVFGDSLRSMDPVAAA